MSKLTLTFDMETERDQAHHAVHADHYYNLLWEIHEICRGVVKYNRDPLAAIEEIKVASYVQDL